MNEKEFLLSLYREFNRKHLELYKNFERTLSEYDEDFLINDKINNDNEILRMNYKDFDNSVMNIKKGLSRIDYQSLDERIQKLYDAICIYTNTSEIITELSDYTDYLIDSLREKNYDIKEFNIVNFNENLNNLINTSHKWSAFKTYTSILNSINEIKDSIVLTAKRVNEIAMVIDFGNANIRVGLKYNYDIHFLKNTDGLSRHPQIIIFEDNQIKSYANEAENNIIGYSDCFYTDIKLGIFQNEKKNFNKNFIIYIINYFKDMSEKYLKISHFNKNAKIDKIIFLVPNSNTINSTYESILNECSGRVNLNCLFKNEEESAIKYYIMNNKNELFKIHRFCVFNLGSINITSSVWKYENSNLKCFNLLNKETTGGNGFIKSIKKIFDKKLKLKILDFYQKTINKCIYHEGLVDNHIFENSKYKAECFKHYRKVFETFSGESKSLSLNFRHFVSGIDLEIEIKRSDIDEELKDMINNVRILIENTKRKVFDFCLIIIGNGIKIPGMRDLFKRSFSYKYKESAVYCDEEVIKGLLNDY